VAALFLTGAAAYGYDAFEPNDSFATAAHLGALGDRTETHLTIHISNNDDFYRFTAAASGTVTVENP
jgi:hypothetical protein